MQLFGAVLLAKMYGASLVEPEWADWDWDASQPQSHGPFETLYDFSHFSTTINNVFNVNVISRNAMSALTKERRVTGNSILSRDHHQCWDVWLSYQRRALKSNILDDFLLRFLSSFKLTETNQRLVDIVLDTISLHSSGNSWNAIHMRTEKDWFKHSQYMKSRINLTEEEAAYVSPMVIRDKFYSTFGLGFSRDQPHFLFIACDEKAQQENPFDLWRPDTRLFHKKDFLELRGCDNKTKSAVDFEICVESPTLVGTSRSSFLRLATLTRFAKTQNRTIGGVNESQTERLGRPTYIYNRRSSQLVKRIDNGLYNAAADCFRKKPVLAKLNLEAIVKDLFWHVRWKALIHRCKGLIKRGVRKSGVMRKSRY